VLHSLEIYVQCINCFSLKFMKIFNKLVQQDQLQCFHTLKQPGSNLIIIIGK